jgi:hypothetical protein
MKSYRITMQDDLTYGVEVSEPRRVTYVMMVFRTEAEAEKFKRHEEAKERPIA